MAKEALYTWWRIKPAASLDYRRVTIPTKDMPAFKPGERRIERENYERGEIEAARVVRLESKVVEFGAGLSIVSMSIANRLSDSYQLVSYEANVTLRPAHAALCRANNVSPVLNNAVVGPEAGEATFNVAENFLSSSIVDRSSKENHKSTVPQATLEQIFADYPADVIVCDIEGGEVLFETAQLPSHIRAFAAEFHPHIIGDATVASIVHNLLNQGLKLLAAEQFGWVMCLERQGSVQ